MSVPAAAPELDRLDPLNPEYHLQDQDEPPKNLPVQIQQRQECTIISKAAEGLLRQKFSGLLCLAMLVAAVLLPILAFPRAADDGEQRIIIACAIMFAFLGTLILTALLFEAYDRYLFMITPTQLVYMHKYLVGRRERVFDWSEIEQVSCTRRDKIIDAYRLVITRRSGESIEIFSSSKPEIVRYLATQLRKLRPHKPAATFHGPSAGSPVSSEGAASKG